ncbi:glycosyltransferase [Winogradskyella sp. E313]|uniref:Glycosyltransferase n=2 Tax=Winogradskyella immobilis TaxID=2816852 RepID=A0ABS8EIP6_9FLAO|nr:glycosyltransferase [Winogradskyella immobilis]
MLSICIITIIIIYLSLMIWLNIGFNKVESFSLQDLSNETKFSIVIPFRNEAEMLPQLLQSIVNLNYKKTYFEIVFVDDDSNDSSIRLINESLKNTTIDFNIINNIRSSNSPKKDAITTAIKYAKYDWIITTDADCILPKYWLDCYDEFIQTQTCIAIAGPVKFIGSSSFFTRFQIMDTLSLQAATIGGFGQKKPFLCNGANFAYQISAFNTVNGFDGNTSIASGDDIFLLEKFIKFQKENVHYLKSDKAIVTTAVNTNLKALINQRLRWASKTVNYKAWLPRIIGLIVFITNFSIITLIPLTLFYLISLKTALLIFLIKASIDLLLLFKASRFFKQEPILLSYVFASLLYPFFNSYIAITSSFTSYQWKGRTFKTVKR